MTRDGNLRFGEMAELSRELRVFRDLAAAAAGAGEPNEILERICSQVRETFGFDRALIARYDEQAHTAHAVVLQGLEWPGDDWLPVDLFPLLERALAGGRAVFVRDPAAEAALPGAVIDRFDVGAIVCAPLLLERRCLGFVVGDRHGGAFEFPPEDEELLTALGLVAAVLIDKADALDEVTRLAGLHGELVSVASHELRTPIAVIHGIAATLHLRGDELRPQQLRDLRATLYAQTGNLRDLTEQLLDISRLDAGAIRVQPQPVRPRECLDRLLPQIVPDRLQDIDVRLDPTVEVAIDLDAFQRIVSNLVTNAVRYGRPPVVIRGGLDGGFRLVVEDRGDGVEPDFVPQLFDRFTRSARTRQGLRGAGLGLSIARSYAQALGGELWYEPAKPRGARFTLVLGTD